ncbi:unnamed protein product [Symbiodinium sp. CCMP2592]|nr:unnamed protein product [Symbiodinium sp. CCMP2592]
MLKERYGEQYDASQMTWAWWRENIKGQASTIVVACKTCGHLSKRTTLNSLKGGSAPGCFCNGGVPWSSREGHERCLLMLKENYGEQYDASQMTWAWWRENIKGQASTIDVTCQTCGHRSKSTILNSLRAGQAPGCFCNGGVPWSSREGHQRCLLMLQERYREQYDADEMTWDWWRENINDRDSTIGVTCRKCGHPSKSTSLHNLKAGQAPGCFCNGGVAWSSREGHERCLLMLKENYAEQYDASQMTWAWWRENIKGQASTIDVICQTCGHRSKGTSLSSLQQGNSPGCLCNKKTEAKLGRWLVREYPDSIITSQLQGCTNPDTGRSLPFDFGLYHDSILIELDGGIGHFGRGFRGDPDDRGVPQRDLHKEYWAMRQGKVVVRLLQTDVYLDSWPWGDFLTSAIQHATGLTQPCVLTQDAVEYKSGIYRKLRDIDGRSREDGSFQEEVAPEPSENDLLVALQKAVGRPAPTPTPAEPEVPAQASPQSAPSAEGRGQIMGRRTFRAGDQAFYWSATHRCWLKTCVLSVNSDGDKSETYNLDCKSKVESWQMRTVDEPRDGPPDCSEGAGGGFAVGMPVQCFNQQKRVWEDGIVVRRYQQDKIIVFDVDCKDSLVRMLPASRLRLSRFTVGDKVEYWSMNAKQPGSFRWSSEAGWYRALKTLKDGYGEQYDASNMTRDRYGKQYDASQMTWAWWKANVKHNESKADVTCKKCGHRSKSTSLNDLRSGHAPGCVCNRKTEAKLRRWLYAKYPEWAITSQVKGCTNGDTQRPLPFDFGLYHDSVLIELDGETAHFGRGFGGVAVDGGDFLTSAIQHATSLTQPCVLTQDAMHYEGGIYRELRTDFDCKRGHFLPSGIPYLTFGLDEGPSLENHAKPSDLH